MPERTSFPLRFGEHRDNSRNSQSVFLVVTLQEIAFLLLTAEKIIPYQQQYQYNNNPNHVTWNNKHKKHTKSNHERGIPHQAFHVFSPIKKTYTIIVYALLFHLARCTFFCYYSILFLFFILIYCIR